MDETRKYGRTVRLAALGSAIEKGFSGIDE
jgi:hypothetical protein